MSNHKLSSIPLLYLLDIKECNEMINITFNSDGYKCIKSWLNSIEDIESALLELDKNISNPANFHINISYSRTSAEKKLADYLLKQPGYSILYTPYFSTDETYNTYKTSVKTNYNGKYVNDLLGFINLCIKFNPNIEFFKRALLFLKM